MTWLKATVILAMVALAACRTQPMATATQSVIVAKQACEINALAEERNAMMKTISSANDYYREGAISQSVDEQRYSILAQKLQQYSGEVEASYRFVTSNCNSYNLCMGENGYDERRCMGTRDAWRESHGRFNQLAIRLKEIEKLPVRTSTTTIVKPNCKDCNPIPPSDCRAVKCNVQGAVFSTGCCYDGD